MSRIVLCMTSTDYDIIKKVSSLIDGRIHPATDKRWEENPHWKKAYQTKITGIKAKELMIKLKPLMGERRQKQIQEAIDCYNKYAPKNIVNEKIARQIIAENKTGNFTQKQIADKYFLSRETVNKICSGKSKKWGYLVNDGVCGR